MTLRPSIETKLQEGTKVLDRAGVLNPKREALAIWAALAGVQLGDVWLRREDDARADDSSRFKAAVMRRASGEPLPYVVGSTGFRTLDIKVDNRALIPRPETEGLIDRVIDWGKEKSVSGSKDWGVAVDVGTGTGCLALSLAVECEFRLVVGIDSSAQALELALENVELVSPKTPVELKHGQFLEPLAGRPIDVLVSNPPYVSLAEYALLESCVKQHEPREALVSEHQGLEHTRRLLEDGFSAVAPGGLIAIEVDSTRAGAVMGLARSAGWTHPHIEDDLFGRPRYFLANKER